MSGEYAGDQEHSHVRLGTPGAAHLRRNGAASNPARARPQGNPQLAQSHIQRTADLEGRAGRTRNILNFHPGTHFGKS